MGCKGPDWRNRGAGCCPVGNEHMAEEKMMMKNIVKGRPLSRTGDEKVVITMWFFLSNDE
jgi:hypothetical protein